MNGPFGLLDARPRPGRVPPLGQHTDELRGELASETVVFFDG
ncbi:MAG TPA: hypothetical protein VN799_03130 [Acidimicrobiales bacterium]|nr:hypothetical protein [Acidimicrobiales bacterium]